MLFDYRYSAASSLTALLKIKITTHSPKLHKSRIYLSLCNCMSQPFFFSEKCLPSQPRREEVDIASL